MQSFLQDVRYAIKQLRKNPGFSFVVILTLALSIGANTAIFSVVDALMLRPLPYPQPERLASLQMRLSNHPSLGQPSDIDSVVWRQLHADVPAVTAAVSSPVGGVNLKADGRAQYVHGQRVSASYFQVLGLRPMLGRTFSEAEDTAGGPFSVVLGYGLWANTFASNPGIIGQSIELKGVPYTVIGVLAPGAQTLEKADLWTSLRPATSQEGGGDNFDPILRLKDDATWQQADAQLMRLQSITTQMLARKFETTVVYQALPLQKSLAFEGRLPALILMAAVGFVLLVACANLAGLALVRIGRRQAEIATRLALGATRWAILRQFWIESLLLTALGIAAALLMGNFTLQLINQRIPGEFLPVGGVAMDARVLVFAIATGMGASLFFGLLPAVSAGRIDVRSAMATSQGRSVAQSGGTRTRYALIVGEVALTVVLLTVAGLLVRTLVYLRTLPPGFNPKNVVVAKASLDDARFHSQPGFLKLLDESTAAMRTIPGVEAVGVGLTVPYERALNYNVTQMDGPNAGTENMTNLVYVTPGYFEALQIGLRSGRLLSAGDTPASHPVAVINETYARRYLGTQNPVGRHVSSDNVAMEVVGVVADVFAPPGISPGAPIVAEPTLYIPATQMPMGTVNLVNMWFQPSWIVRSQGRFGGLTQQMQQAMASVDPNLPISGFFAMNDVLAQTLVLQHMEVSLLATLAGLALLLSSVGIYGLVSNLVNQRTREFGIRMALGCTLRGAMVEVSRTGVLATASGLLGGLLLSLLAVKVLQSQLFGVGLYDPATLGAVSVLLMVVAFLAALLPALRIARIDPAATLRSE